MNKSKLIEVLVIGVMAAGPAFGANFFESGSVHPDLRKAHEAYLEGDKLEMANSVKRVLELSSTTDLEKKNALDLLDKAFETFGGSIPVNWRLPSEVTKMVLAVRRREGVEPTNYSLRVRGNIVTPKIIKQLQLVRYPNEVVLDKEAGIGEWEEEMGDDGPEYHLREEGKATPPAEGLYLLNLALSNGKQLNGWVILQDLISTASPRVKSPANGQHYSTSQPTFKWVDFYSPQYKAFERRSSSVLILNQGPNYEVVWDRYEVDPMATETTVGVDPLGKGVSVLSSQKYLFYLNYSERRNFGDLSLRRESATLYPFYVKTK